MKIAVNTRMLIQGRLEGIGVFAHELLSRYTRQHPEHEFIFLFDRKFDDAFVYSKNVKPIVTGFPTRHSILYYSWFEFFIPSVLKREKADLFFSPEGYLSLHSMVPSVNVIHDLNFEENRYGMPILDHRFYKHYFPKYARHARRVATVSEFSKHDIMNRYGVEAARIDVIYDAAAKGFAPVNETINDHVRKRFTNGAPYFLFVGALHPRKNIAALLKAFELFKDKNNSPFKLVLAGNRKWWNSEMESVFNAMKHQGAVVFTGRLSQPDLEALTAAAFAAVNVSLYEGFGIPLLEAMQSGVPVIASRASCFPEIGGDAILFCDAHNTESIAGAMNELAVNKESATDLIRKGLDRSACFSWDRSTENLDACFKKAIQFY